LSLDFLSIDLGFFRSLVRFVDRMNHNELIYRQVRYVDDQGREIAKVANGAIDPNRADVSADAFFRTVKQLPHDGMYASPAAPTMTYALPVYDTSGGRQAPTLLGAMVVDFSYPLDDFQRSARFIAISFFIITTISLAGALLLTVNRVRRLTRPIRRLAGAADQIAAGRRDIVVNVGTKDEVGRLAQSFNDMAAALKWNEGALQRKITETTALYEIGQEISAQVSLEPTAWPDDSTYPTVPKAIMGIATSGRIIASILVSMLRSRNHPLPIPVMLRPMF
jgi:HAMP domain-containing protein